MAASPTAAHMWPLNTVALNTVEGRDVMGIASSPSSLPDSHFCDLQ